MGKPVRIGLACVALNLALNLAFMKPLEHMGPALATSLAAMVNTVWLAISLRRHGFFVPDAVLRRRVAGMAAATAAMVLALLAAKGPVMDLISGVRGLKWLALAVLVALGGLVYAAAGQALGAFDIRVVARRVLRRGK